MEPAFVRRQVIDSLLSINQAEVVFKTSLGDVRAVDKVSLSVESGMTVALVGESGCGKTTLARSILGLQELTGGEILVKGKSMKSYGSKIVNELGMIWQDPFASLNPRWTVKKSIEEPFRLAGVSPSTEELLLHVGLDPSVADRYPHELSGGQRQRAAIGRAIALKPSLVICDEPTAALDLSIRAQILNLLKDIQAEFQTSFFYISHDLSTVQYIADYVAVMYLGIIVEEGKTEEVFSSPSHPYTKALLESAPTLEQLQHLPDPLPGEVPDPRNPVTGCKFHPRCKFAQEMCSMEVPVLKGEAYRQSACFFPLKGFTDERRAGN